MGEKYWIPVGMRRPKRSTANEWHAQVAFFTNREDSGCGKEIKCSSFLFLLSRTVSEFGLEMGYMTALNARISKIFIFQSRISKQKSTKHCQRIFSAKHEARQFKLSLFEVLVYYTPTTCPNELITYLGITENRYVSTSFLRQTLTYSACWINIQKNPQNELSTPLKNHLKSTLHIFLQNVNAKSYGFKNLPKVT